MELAYREQPQSEAEVIREAKSGIVGSILVIVAVSLLLVLLAPVVPVWMTVSLSGPVVFFLLLIAIKNGDVSPLRLVLVVGLPPLVALLMHAIAAILVHRMTGAIVFGVIALIALARLASKPFEFFQDWILTHPRLRTEQRAALAIELRRRSVQAVMTFIVLASLTVLASLVNNTLGIAVGLVICALSSTQLKPAVEEDEDDFGLMRSLRYAERLVAYFVRYGRNPSGAAGAWYPAGSSNRGLLIVTGILLPMTLMLAAATSGFSVWDAPVCRDRFIDTFDKALHDRDLTRILISATPDVDWREFLEAEDEVDPSDEESETTSDAGDASGTEEPPASERQIEILADALSTSPSLWVVVAMAGVVDGELWILWPVVLSIVLGLVVSVLFPLACLRPLLRAVWVFEHEIVASVNDDERPIWQCFVDRMRLSSHQHTTEDGDVIREADHTFFGVSTIADYPVLLHKPLFDEHCYIVGQTGSGKTSLGIMPLLIQLIRGSASPPEPSAVPAAEPESDASTTEEDLPDEEKETNASATASSEPQDCDELSPVVIIDLKGDPALFHTIRAEAAARGQEFRFFTPEQNLATHVFNPFSNFSTQSRSLLQVCQLILDALGLNHGEGYGRSYFTRQNREALFDALNSDPTPQTFKELSDILKSFRGRPNYPDIFELVSTIHALTQYPQLETIEPVSDPDSSIHMPTVLERRQVVYFWLPAAIESITVREIGKLALFSLLSASIDRQRSGQDTRRTYLFIDEFQRLVGENFRIVLEQARSYGLSCFMANQTQADLNLPEMDLRPTVRTNTRVKMNFGVTDVSEIQELSKLSGQEIAVMRGQGFSKSSAGVRTSSVTFSESMKDRFLPSDILNATDHPRRCILHVTRGSGYSQFAGLPTIVDCFHPITRELYVARSRMPWPEIESAPGTTSSEVDMTEIERKRNRTLVGEQEDTLKQLFEQTDARFRADDQS